MVVRCVILDNGGFLSSADGATSVTDALAAVSPYPRARIAGLVRRTLHPATTLDLVTLTTAAREAGISVSDLRRVLAHPAPLQLRPEARPGLARLRHRLPETRFVVLSNATLAQAEHAARLRAELGDLLDGVFISHETGLSKGIHWKAIGQIIEGMRVHASEVLHVGDKYREDVAAPLQVGCRALWVHPNYGSTPPPAGPDRYRAAATFTAAIDEIERWVLQAAAEPATLPVRASVLLRDPLGRTLIGIGPDDARRGKSWSLPGGRCMTYGQGDDPATAAVRELWEETGIRGELDDAQAPLVAWSAGESARGENKLIFVFTARAAEAATPRIRDHEELAHLRWATPEDCADLLDGPELERVRAVDAGERFLVQRNVAPC